MPGTANGLPGAAAVDVASPGAAAGGAGLGLPSFGFSVDLPQIDFSVGFATGSSFFAGASGFTSGAGIGSDGRAAGARVGRETVDVRAPEAPARRIEMTGRIGAAGVMCAPMASSTKMTK